MVQRREYLRLSLESSQSFGVLGELLGEHFDRDIPPELQVLRPVNFAHSAFADELEDLVVCEFATSFNRHDSALGETLPLL